MNPDFKKVPVDDRLTSIKESLSILHDTDEPTHSRSFHLDKATVSDFVAYGSDLSRSGHTELLEDWEHNLHRIERQQENPPVQEPKTSPPAAYEEKSLLRELEEDFKRQQGSSRPPSDRPTEELLAEKEKSLSLLRTAYYHLLTKYDALEKKYKSLQRAQHKQSTESYKSLAAEVDLLREKNRGLVSEMRDLKIELRRRPPRKVLDDTKTKIRELENLIDLPRCVSPLGRHHTKDPRLVQTLVSMLQLSSADTLPKAIKGLLMKNAKYQRFRDQLLDLIAEHSPDLALPSMKQLFRWIRRLFEEYIALKKQTQMWKSDQHLIRVVMREVGVVNSGDLLSAVRELTRVVY